MIGNTNIWYGLDENGGELMIDHGKLMDWAFGNDLQFTVGWSHKFERKCERLVRGPKMLSVARAAGWNDIADKLKEFGFEDGD